MKAVVAAWAGRAFKTTTDSGARSDTTAVTEIINYSKIDPSNRCILQIFHLTL